jgi:hypothetical protein
LSTAGSKSGSGSPARNRSMQSSGHPRARQAAVAFNPDGENVVSSPVGATTLPDSNARHHVSDTPAVLAAAAFDKPFRLRCVSTCSPTNVRHSVMFMSFMIPNGGV